MPKYQHLHLPVLAAMRHVTWETDPKDFQQLLFTAEMKRTTTSRFGIVNAYARSEERIICSGELTFSFLS